jgi:pimeloyl-ACP methyl ester carboxylesterase
MPTLEARGVEIAWTERGEGRPVLLIHETATSGTIWEPLSEALSGRARVIAYDRRGWGSSTVPDGYQRTTVEEQSEDLVSLVESAAAAPVTLCGAGIGAVIALDLLLRCPELISGAVLIEPALISLVPAATEVLSDDRIRLHEAMAGGGTDEAVRLLLSGALEGLGPGMGRLIPEATADARDRPGVLFAELGATAAWGTPLSRLGRADRPSVIVTSGSTPRLLRDASTAVATRLQGSAERKLDAGDLPPHLGAPDEVADIALELSR